LIVVACDGRASSIAEQEQFSDLFSRLGLLCSYSWGCVHVRVFHLPIYANICIRRHDSTAHTNYFICVKEKHPPSSRMRICVHLATDLHIRMATHMSRGIRLQRERKERKKKKRQLASTEGRRDLFTFRRVSDSRDENQRNFLSRLCVWVSLAARCRHRYFRIFDEAMSIAYDITQYPWLIYIQVQITHSKQLSAPSMECRLKLALEEKQNAKRAIGRDYPANRF
jgi:hypothetical protein